MPNAFVKTSTGWAPLQTGPAGPPGLVVYEQPAAPSSPEIGDVWIDTDDVPPSGSAGSLVTSLPSNPVNGYECYFLADDANGVVWRLRYRSTSASVYKWEFVGGSSVSRERQAAETASLPGSAITGFNANDPVVTAPLAGEYRCEHSACFMNDNSAASQGAYGIGLKLGSAEVGNDGMSQGHIDDRYEFITVEQKRTVIATVGLTIAQVYSQGGYTGNIQLRARALFVTPVRVS